MNRVFDGHETVYLDSAATCLAPDCVIDAMTRFEKTSRSNVHRGIHPLAEEASAAYETARDAVARFIGACPQHVAFTRGATDALNIIAASCAQGVLREGDVIVIFEDSHHANIVPWQMAARRAGARIEMVRIGEDALVDEKSWRRMLAAAPRIVALSYGGNVVGSCEGALRRCAEARDAGAFVVLDCAQRVGHAPLDVSALPIDAAAFSAHKMYGPMGIGALWCSEALIERIEPPIGGGGAVVSVDEKGFSTLPFPRGFEPGTPAVACAVGFADAVRFLEEIGMEAVEAHDAALASYACARLGELEFVSLVGRKDMRRCGIVSFSVEGVHPHDVAQVCADRGIAVRAGHHCAMPLHRRMGLVASVRSSFGVYNERSDVDRLCEALHEAHSMFA